MLLRFDPLRAGTAVRFSVAELARETTRRRRSHLSLSLSFFPPICSRSHSWPCLYDDDDFSLVEHPGPPQPTHYNDNARLCWNPSRFLVQAAAARAPSFSLFLGSRKTPRFCTENDDPLLSLGHSHILPFHRGKRKCRRARALSFFRARRNMCVCAACVPVCVREV